MKETKRFQTIGYQIQRESKKTYTFAVVFKNLSSGQIGASFHISKVNAESRASGIRKYSHLQFIEIVPVILV